MKDHDRNVAFILPQAGRGDDPEPRHRAPLRPFAVPNMPRRSRLNRGWLWTLAAIWLLTLSIFAYRKIGPFLEPASGPSDELGLGVERNGPTLTMTWDANSPVVREAHKGVLSIVDGSHRKEMDLDAVQLHHGHILYSPDTDDVFLQLELVTSRQEPVTESLRVVDPAQGRTNAAATEPRKEAARWEYDVPRTPAPVPSRKAPATLAQAQPPTAAKLPQVSAPRRGAVFANRPAVARPGSASVNYSGPRPIYQVSPSVPQAMRGFITRDTAVEVRVSIDAAGKVTRAEALSSGNPYLSKLSASTATEWQFEPARMKGRNVPSEMKLVFRYRAGAR